MAQEYSIRLTFGGEVPETIRRRISYAFRVFCGVYGFVPAEEGGIPNLCYGVAASSRGDVELNAAYDARGTDRPASSPAWHRIEASGASALPVEAGAGEFKVPVFHRGRESKAGPDWLGEVFEWISAADELSVEQSDSVGRIPYQATLHGRFGLDPSVPYAAVAMDALNREIRRIAGAGWPEHPISPWPRVSGCTVAATHDVDFLPVSAAKSAHRLLKNFGIAVLLRREPGLAFSVLRASLRALTGGPSPIHTIEPMIERELALGIRSSCNMIVRNTHRRDATYEIHDPKVARVLKRIVEAQGEVGLHGSYTSLESTGRLAEEFRVLRETGLAVVGGRQHWLRYYHFDRLMCELVNADAWYDSTAGYSGCAGFRNGASFPFPPYDFARESAYPLLEIPLAIMDVSLCPSGGQARKASQVAERVMSGVRSWGWGGVSILWHDTVFGGAQVEQSIADLYWQLKRPEDQWLTCREIASTVWPRFARAGLLPPSPPEGLAGTDAGAPRFKVPMHAKKSKGGFP